MAGELKMDVREKLVDIVCDAMEADGCIGHCNHPPCFAVERVVNALFAHGVTVQEWISVKDRLPERGQEVIVYSGGVLKPTVFAYQFGNKHYDSWARITHWMPLPEPPKGE